MKKLGNTDLQTAPIVFGGNVFGWTLNEKESFRILDEFVDAGFNTIDTANVYSRWVPGNEGGESETIIGKWMKERGNRDKVTVITKVGSDMGQGHRDLSEKHIMEAVEDSLRRLQTDAIDLYLSHWDDENTPVEETLGAYGKLIKAGKVRFIGASNLPPERLKESLNASMQNGLPRYEVFQPEYNLFDRQGFEEGVAPVCREEGLGVITYFSLAKGFLSGKYRSKDDLGKSVRGGGVEGYLNERGFRILKALDELAAKHEVSQAAVALAWLIHQPDVTAPIASATKSNHLKAFTEAMQMKPEPEDMQLLEKASAYQ
ncbi:NADP-dependent aryl-alcohol dehydrogenase [Prolixibacter bellariivorans]|uniref:NADP-dependent aryl-alcohol dehydrogenase n=1 Tax=Prolixibacter bellariivorans TaxID=314319 RepID=A0A5M4AVL3_9BACT|nr:aldo/keto reductase [Prolixibacter bellariivorans]GET31591.1 NADP-dependent aryl-alcohol dehydrogenase [Prolixibacter bellariivorans]